MAELSTSTEIDAPASRVWALLEDFGAIERWWPSDGPISIESVRIEGEGVGMIRHIQNRGVANCTSERLDLLDPQTRTLILSIVGDRPPGMTAYVAEGRVVELDAQRCRVDYRANVTTVAGREEKMVKAIRYTWTEMFRGLARAASAGDARDA